MTSWTATLTGPEDEKFDYTGIYTANGCIPVIIFMDNDNHNYQAHYMNVTVEPLDSDVFAIRKECAGL